MKNPGRSNDLKLKLTDEDYRWTDNDNDRKIRMIIPKSGDKNNNPSHGNLV